jgi:hypothetical protein
MSPRIEKFKLPQDDVYMTKEESRKSSPERDETVRESSEKLVSDRSSPVRGSVSRSSPEKDSY